MEKLRGQNFFPAFFLLLLYNFQIFEKKCDKKRIRFFQILDILPFFYVSSFSDFLWIFFGLLGIFQIFFIIQFKAFFLSFQYFFKIFYSYFFGFFKALALWADAFYKSKCPKLVFFADFALQNMVETKLPDGLETSGGRVHR